jgi:hypothetical protein
MLEQRSDGVFVRRGFLSPPDLMKVLSALERLAPSWTLSEELGLLGRGRTVQVRPGDIAAQAPLDEVRRIVAPQALAWARACGFWLPSAPRLQMFPVRMIGDRLAPPRQEPHVDTYGGPSDVPVCTIVFYAKAHRLTGGDLIVAAVEPDRPPLALQPTPNSIASFAGDRVHWVAPLFDGERLSVVINLY